jgi:hypothetical protein
MRWKKEAPIIARLEEQCKLNANLMHHCEALSAEKDSIEEARNDLKGQLAIVSTALYQTVGRLSAYTNEHPEALLKRVLAEADETTS